VVVVVVVEFFKIGFWEINSASRVLAIIFWKLHFHKDVVVFIFQNCIFKNSSKLHFQKLPLFIKIAFSRITFIFKVPFLKNKRGIFGVC